MEDIKALIIKRRSIRKYEAAPPEGSVLTEIAEFIKATEPLIPDSGKYSFKIIGSDEFFASTGGAFRIRAPYYIVFFGDGTDEAYRNIGYAGELAVLKLTAMNIGTCWLGGANSKETTDGNAYAISIAFGKPSEEFRKSMGEADRNPLDKIAQGYDDEQREMLEYVRIAPSAVNYQPWSFRCEKGEIHVFRRKTGGMMTMIKSIRTLQKIDIGIAVAHFTIKKFRYERKDIADEKMTYEGTLVFDQ